MSSVLENKKIEELNHAGEIITLAIQNMTLLLCGLNYDAEKIDVWRRLRTTTLVERFKVSASVGTKISLRRSNVSSGLETAKRKSKPRLDDE